MRQAIIEKAMENNEFKEIVENLMVVNSDLFADESKIATLAKMAENYVEENRMKQWTIDEFLRECEELCWNQYTYDYNKMPEGICNGHNVKPYRNSWHSIVIDGVICNMATYSEKWPNGHVGYMVSIDDKYTELSALEYVRYKLEQMVVRA